jgi:mono/diheme cytochrome c family protein
MPSRAAVLVLSLSALALTKPTAIGDTPQPRKSIYADVAPVLGKYCVSCHGNKKQSAGLNLEKYQDEAAALKDAKTWDKVLFQVRSGEMPPKTRRQPTAAERDALTSWADDVVLAALRTERNPGRVTLRRLNRAEYRNTIRDLVGIDFKAADDFPADDVGYGFDNIGDVLSLPPLLMEKYLAAAEQIIGQAIVPGAASRVPTKRFSARDLATNLPEAPVQGNLRVLPKPGELTAEHPFPQAGDYVVRIRAAAQRRSRESLRMALQLDGQTVRTFDVRNRPDNPQVLEGTVKVAAGKRRLGVAFLDEPADVSRNGERKLLVEWVEFQGPIDQAPPGVPESHRRVMICQPTSRRMREECASRILENFARRAYRRPVTTDEVNKLVGFVQLAESQGESWDRGIMLGLQAVLVSPHFLFRVELDPRGGGAYALNDFELASRLSYFLWSSMPDEELSRHAREGTLRKNLASQVLRMLKDTKSRALIENFAGQWLQLRNLKTVTPDPGRFPGFNEPLRADMQRETELFFEAVVREDRSILDFLDADFTFLNERLARHYGILNVTGNDFRRVLLPPGPRGGLLTQASILTLTSNPTRTSPVKRGKWILETVLGTPPPPPPPDAGELPDDQNKALTGTLRQRMEQHRTNPTCASCHQRMDPLGFGFENFDAVGAWRDRDGGQPIDPSGTLPSGQSFQGPKDLKGILQGQKELFARCLAEKLLTYATGRGMEFTDRPVVEKVTATAAANGFKFSSLIHEIVKSDPFQMRSAK